MLAPERRQTLIARRAGESGRDVVYQMNIVLQGAAETVFFEIAAR